MGLLDKVKEQAGQIAEKAQQGVAQGKDKLEELQIHKKGDGLLRDIGSAYFEHVRHGGPKEAVEAALAAMDAHVAEHGQPEAPSSVALTDPPPA